MDDDEDVQQKGGKPQEAVNTGPAMVSDTLQFAIDLDIWVKIDAWISYHIDLAYD